MPEGVGIALERLTDRINQKVIINRIRETLLQEGGFTYLACPKEEHSFIQLGLYIEDSLVHVSLEFKEVKSDFPMKIGNTGANLIKFIEITSTRLESVDGYRWRGRSSSS